MFFEDDYGKILTDADINDMFPWELDEFELHVHEKPHDYKFIDERKLLAAIKKRDY